MRHVNRIVFAASLIVLPLTAQAQMATDRDRPGYADEADRGFDFGWIGLLGLGGLAGLLGREKTRFTDDQRTAAATRA